jgi:hypothetical protein
MVMAGLVPAIHAFRSGGQGVDARDKPAHDDQCGQSNGSHPRN